MPSPLRFPELLRRADQAAVAGLLVLGAAAVVAWLVVQGGLRRRMIEVDRPAPKYARFQVNINAADCPELIQLPGIGDDLALRIVENRREQGPFRTLEELRRVPGIGPKTFEKLRPYLCPLNDPGQLAKNGKGP
ncbi:MAG: helix-hairpin-helix domain-containing protein [Pirellulales bacterium]|nr:helix-hairpin-helix domain-containing protein [Pirellulales bacterium]